MTIANITLTDRENGNIDLEAKLDNPNAVNEVPTAALVVVTYIAAHFEKICLDASEWFVTQTLANAEDSPVADIPSVEIPAVETR